MMIWSVDSDLDDDNEFVVTTSDEEDLPFACFICRDEFVKPVVTKYVGDVFMYLFNDDDQWWW